VTGAAEPRLESIPEEFKKRAGVFVSIKKHGHLRGCIGTVEPYQENIAAEIMANALSAGLRDPRFHPVRQEELDDLEYSVDVLQPPEPVASIQELDPVKYGVIVRAGSRSGLLLPNLEGINTAEEQVAIARQKAGIGPEEEVQLARFEVVRYE
jgi:AmmeMemoRadiSam system protein A